MSSSNGPFFVGVDVGTGSARAALITDSGKIISKAVSKTKTWALEAGYYEQSSDDIWNACCTVVKKVVADVPPSSVKGIGFDATCSLVAVDGQGKPLTVSPTGKNNQNVILWLDHRAFKEAEFINSLNHDVLKYVGGKISLEMETPKLLWLKRNLPEKCWKKAGYFFDLPDFLTWRATDCDSRSLCSLVCKWTYQYNPEGKKGWDESYFKEIGLGDLIDNNWGKIGNNVKVPGSPCGSGLSVMAAAELGLEPGTPVGTSLIDAHAGGLGMIGCSAGSGISEEFTSRLGLICGTSTCHMAISKGATFVEGVWGPYYSAMVPGFWLNEGGQSATGKLVDYIIETHPASQKLRNRIGQDSSIQDSLNGLLEVMCRKKEVPTVSYLAKDLHVWPDFHGNRSPVADPTLLGMISGLDLSSDEESLALLYLATIQALSYGTKHIIQELQSAGHRIESVLLCGGLSKNQLFVQTQADVLGLPVICPEEEESVLIGSAILGACAAGVFPDMDTAIRKMGGTAKVIRPQSIGKKFHDKKYKVFLKMLEDQRSYKEIMSQDQQQ